jgi:plasmid stability protein
MAQVLVREVDEAIVTKLKKQAERSGRSLPAELKSALEARAGHASKAEARALAARIRRRIGKRPQTDSSILQREGRI